MNISATKATLSFSDRSAAIDMRIYKGTVGPYVIDIHKLYAQTGKFTYDPGFMSTLSLGSESSGETPVIFGTHSLENHLSENSLRQTRWAIGMIWPPISMPSSPTSATAGGAGECTSSSP
jgi:hypothetical protein